MQTMLGRTEEAVRNIPVSAYATAAPVIRCDEEDPVALQQAEQFRAMLREGIARYLTYLDPEQQGIAKINARGLLLVKGGAGTGKTAVAIHRVKWLADRPVLPGAGPERVLYLCYNRVLANTVSQLLDVLYAGSVPDTVVVNTFHTWCAEFLARAGVTIPSLDEGRCRDAVRMAFGRVTPGHRPALAGLRWYFVADEIEQVIKYNGIVGREDYLAFSRHKRPGIKNPTREAIWAIYERARDYELEWNVCRYADLPLLALATLEAMEAPPQYRAIIIDEGQDCSPVMIRLARRLLVEAGGPLTVFADPAQGVYECGFQWTKKELRPKGGNVRTLRKTYRTTREIHDLAQPLRDGDDDLLADDASAEPPARHGPRPRFVAAESDAELQAELVRCIKDEIATHHRPANQIAVLAHRWETLRGLARALEQAGVPVAPPARGMLDLMVPTVKLLTMHGAKGLDFPVVCIIGPHRDDLGGRWRTDLPETRHLLYVAFTRASESLTVGFVNGKQHPLLEVPESECYEAVGSAARSFVNLRGVEEVAPT
jgi:superfamily I DNA/RNA helicase